MSWSLFSRPKLTKTFGIIDISGSSIGYAVVASKKVGNSTCPYIFSTRRESGHKTNFELDRYKTITNNTIKRLLELQTTGSNPPAHYYCFLPSIFYINQTRLINFHPTGAAVKVTESLLHDLTLAEAEKFRASIGQDTTRLIESRIMSVKLNGYSVAEPIGKKAHSLQIALYVAVAPIKVLQATASAIIAVSHREKIHFHTSTFALYSTMRDLLGDKSFLTIDVSGEITDVTVVSQGVIMETFSFPFGKNHLLRRIARLAGGLGAAESVLSHYSGGNTYHDKRLAETLANAATEWQAMFVSAVEKLSTQTIIPDQFYLTSDDHVSNIFATWLAGPAVHKLPISTNKQPVINTINSQLFKGFCEGSPLSNDHQLMAEALFCDKLERNNL